MFMTWAFGFGSIFQGESRIRIHMKIKWILSSTVYKDFELKMRIYTSQKIINLLNTVELGPSFNKLFIKIFQALQEELHLIILAFLRYRSLTVKYKDWKQLSLTIKFIKIKGKIYKNEMLKGNKEYSTIKEQPNYSYLS